MSKENRVLNSCPGCGAPTGGAGIACTFCNTGISSLEPARDSVNKANEVLNLPPAVSVVDRDGSLVIEWDQNKFNRIANIPFETHGGATGHADCVVMPKCGMPGMEGVTISMDVGQQGTNFGLARARTNFAPGIEIPELGQIANGMVAMGYKVQHSTHARLGGQYIVTGREGNTFRMNSPQMLIASDAEGNALRYSEGDQLTGARAKEFLEVSANMWDAMRDVMQNESAPAEFDMIEPDQTKIENAMISTATGVLGLFVGFAGVDMANSDFSNISCRLADALNLYPATIEKGIEGLGVVLTIAGVALLVTSLAYGMENPSSRGDSSTRNSNASESETGDDHAGKIGVMFDRDGGMSTYHIGTTGQLRAIRNLAIKDGQPGKWFSGKNR